jgi:hypothetical protein
MKPRASTPNTRIPAVSANDSSDSRTKPRVSLSPYEMLSAVMIALTARDAL